MDTIDRESQSWWAWAKRVGWNIVTFGGLWSYLWDKLKSCLTSRLCIGATALILTVVGCMWRASIQCQETEETQCNLYDTAVTTYDMISTFMGKYWFEFKSLISDWGSYSWDMIKKLGSFSWNTTKATFGANDKPVLEMTQTQIDAEKYMSLLNNAGIGVAACGGATTVAGFLFAGVGAVAVGGLCAAGGGTYLTAKQELDNIAIEQTNIAKERELLFDNFKFEVNGYSISPFACFGVVLLYLTRGFRHKAFGGSKPTLESSIETVDVFGKAGRGIKQHYATALKYVSDSIHSQTVAGVQGLYNIAFNMYQAKQLKFQRRTGKTATIKYTEVSATQDDARIFGNYG